MSEGIRADREFVERMGGVMVQSGVPPMAARVWARMLVSDSGALTSAELAEALEVSQPSISGAVRFLAQLGFVRRERVPRTRKDRYRIDDQVWESVLSLRNDALDEWKSALQYGVDLHGRDSAVGERLAEAVAFFEFVQEDMRGLLGRWHEHRRSRA
ncbi:GbsR/MarR family transcriptional regulator [Nocardia asteroides]|uniref:GbsR/MarR family transcriptional regulator n=1 Tax=Nocardia asteroides TaxID=1824 RepID=UPI003790E9FE